VKPHKYVLLAGLVTALSACGANDGSPREGQYQQTVKITVLDFPGVDGEQKAQLIEQMEAVVSGQAGLFCMKGNDGGAQWKEASAQMANALGGKCATTKDEGTATRINLEMQCTATAKGDINVTMDGRATTEGYDSSMTFDMKDPANGEVAKLAMNIGAERVGDCGG